MASRMLVVRCVPTQVETGGFFTGETEQRKDLYILKDGEERLIEIIEEISQS